MDDVQQCSFMAGELLFFHLKEMQVILELIETLQEKKITASYKIRQWAQLLAPQKCRRHTF